MSVLLETNLIYCFF